MQKINTPTIKYDTATNWAKAKNYIPEPGVFIVYSTEVGLIPQIKLGDGQTKVNDLPFINSAKFEIKENVLTIL